jgi:hypothetical protein
MACIFADKLECKLPSDVIEWLMMLIERDSFKANASRHVMRAGDLVPSGAKTLTFFD